MRGRHATWPNHVARLRTSLQFVKISGFPYKAKIRCRVRSPARVGHDDARPSRSAGPFAEVPGSMSDSNWPSAPYPLLEAGYVKRTCRPARRSLAKRQKYYPTFAGKKSNLRARKQKTPPRWAAKRTRRGRIPTRTLRTSRTLREDNQPRKERKSKHKRRQKAL